MWERKSIESVLLHWNHIHCKKNYYNKHCSHRPKCCFHINPNLLLASYWGTEKMGTTGGKKEYSCRYHCSALFQQKTNQHVHASNKSFEDAKLERPVREQTD